MIQRTYSTEVTPDRDGEELAVAGHVHELRDIGGLAFLLVRDREGLTQVVVKEDETPELLEAVRELPRESVVRVTGTVTESDQAPGGAELHPEAMEVVSEARADPPLDVAKDVDADRSTRLDNRVVDLRTPERRAVFSLRSTLLAAMTEWFEREGYEEVDTPLISAGGAEGGADLFPVHYYGREAFLSQSPQLYKQMLVTAGFDKLYEVGTAFRAEDFATSRHVSEIAMFDVELGYVEDHHDVMDVQEESLRYALRAAATDAERELEVLGTELSVPEDPFPRLTFEEARELLAEEFGHEPEDPTDLDTEGERLLGRHFAERGYPAVFVVGYPDEKFYYRQDVPGDEIASRKFDLIYRGLELSSGGQREHDYDRLRDRLVEEGGDPADFEFYLDAFQYGVPPHGGYGLGIDRLVKQVAELDNVKEAILFPRTPKRITP
jgi:nondiscriminating aspartyl-tRNA synthetase